MVLVLRLLLLTGLIVLLGFLFLKLWGQETEKKKIQKQLLSLLQDLEKEYKSFIEDKFNELIIKGFNEEFYFLRDDSLRLLRPHIEAIAHFVATNKISGLDFSKANLEIFKEVAVLTESMAKSKTDYKTAKNELEKILHYTIEADINKRFAKLNAGI